MVITLYTNRFNIKNILYFIITVFLRENSHYVHKGHEPGIFSGEAMRFLWCRN
jgi:hypothetical protein